MMIIETPNFQRIFLHFFDLHFLELKGAQEEGWKVKRNIKAECRLATRFALLAADQVLLPAASFFESEICYEIIGELQDVYPSGILYLVGGGENLQEFIESKLLQYTRQSIQFKRYTALKKKLLPHPPFLNRIHSSTEDISQGWGLYLKRGRLRNLIQGTRLSLPSGFENAWAKVPERLENRAFIVPHVEQLLFSNPNPGTIRNRLYGIINEQYFASFTRELCSGVVTDLVYLASPHVIPSYAEDIPYRDLTAQTRRRKLLSIIGRLNGNQLLVLKNDPGWMECLNVSWADFRNRQITELDYVKASFMSNLKRATIGIITALPEEFAAICEILETNEPIDVAGMGAGRKYSLARIRTNTGVEHIVAVCMVSEMGNNSAAIRATKLMFHCPKVTHIIMCGIAGAVPNPLKAEDHVRLGDIVVSNREGVIQYDLDKETPSEVQYRHPPRPPSAALLEAVKWLTAGEFRNSRPWDDYIQRGIWILGNDWNRPSDDCDTLSDSLDNIQIEHPIDIQRLPGLPKVFHGPIASANKLLKNPTKRNTLRDKFGVKAVEMESSGIADASWDMEIGYVVIRGTCDYCNSDKGDVWHKYASIIAAAYTRALIEVLSPTFGTGRL